MKSCRSICDINQSKELVLQSGNKVFPLKSGTQVFGRKDFDPKNKKLSKLHLMITVDEDEEKIYVRKLTKNPVKVMNSSGKTKDLKSDEDAKIKVGSTIDLLGNQELICTVDTPTTKSTTTTTTDKKRKAEDQLESEKKSKRQKLSGKSTDGDNAGDSSEETTDSPKKKPISLSRKSTEEMIVDEAKEVKKKSKKSKDRVVVESSDSDEDVKSRKHSKKSKVKSVEDTSSTTSTKQDKSRNNSDSTSSTTSTSSTSSTSSTTTIPTTSTTSTSPSTSPKKKKIERTATEEMIFNIRSAELKKRRTASDLRQQLEIHDNTKSMEERMKQELADREFAEKFLPKECSICMESYDIDFMQQLMTCSHEYCRDCLKIYYESEINEKRLPIKCPKCKTDVTDLDLQLILEPKLIEKYEKFSLEAVLEKNPNMFVNCLTTDCEYKVFRDTKDSPDFKCPLCQKRYCLNCRVPYHSGFNCEQYQEWSIENGLADDKFEEFIKWKRCQKCPGCRQYVEKNKGCNHMSCRCGSEFCYVCGGDYPCKNVHNEEYDDEEDEEEDEEEEY
eukprot:TRINITY_DN397_c2_g1_i7.p1 TRINITY_DN397_c2_g1~~TRINITY_DN397_c2_g1_i7.p1  ORF type:complete len:558 (+),score=140.50 TRINITY_DN397_c2_g1_i7:117-1790(+)